MDKIIKLKSRGNRGTYLKRMEKPDGSESKTYVLKLEESSILRHGYLEDGRQFMDPSGGPMIAEGGILEEAGAKVRFINFVQGYGWTVTFE